MHDISSLRSAWCLFVGHAMPRTDMPIMGTLSFGFGGVYAPMLVVVAVVVAVLRLSLKYPRLYAIVDRREWVYVVLCIAAGRYEKVLCGSDVMLGYNPLRIFSVQGGVFCVCHIRNSRRECVCVYWISIHDLPLSIMQYIMARIKGNLRRQKFTGVIREPCLAQCMSHTHNGNHCNWLTQRLAPQILPSNGGMARMADSMIIALEYLVYPLYPIDECLRQTRMMYCSL